MRQIPLTKGLVAMVDDEDFDLISQVKWQAMSGNTTPYARHNWRDKVTGKWMTDLMHRVITGVGPGMVVDHLDRNGLNNCRSNLRICTVSENNARRISMVGSLTGFRGVRPNGNAFAAKITFNRRSIHLGTFPTPELAARAYDAAALDLHGPFACLNFSRDAA